MFEKILLLEDEVEKLREDISYLKDEEALSAKNKELLSELSGLKQKEAEYKAA